MSDRGKKFEVLKFVAERERVTPQSVAYWVCPSLKAAYVYLLKLHRQGLLYRRQTEFGIFYRISPRGKARLLFLSSKRGVEQ